MARTLAQPLGKIHPPRIVAANQLIAEMCHDDQYLDPDA